MSSGVHHLYSSQHSHLKAIAKCHTLCFPGSLSNKLGIAYVQKTFEWFLVDEKRFLFHIEKDGKIVGYCGGFISKGIGDGSSSGMLQHAFKQAVVGIIMKPWLAFHKEIRAAYPFIFRNIKRKILPSKKKPFVPSADGERESLSGLVVIGVHPDYRGTGIYNELMEHFFEESKRLGAVGSKLSVKKDNKRGIGAYTKVGWVVDEEHSKTYVLKRMF